MLAMPMQSIAAAYARAPRYQVSAIPSYMALAKVSTDLANTVRYRRGQVAYALQTGAFGPQKVALLDVY